MPRHTSTSKWVRATYEISSPDLEKSAKAICRGQTIGNPTVTAFYETDAIQNRHLAKATWTSTGRMTVEYPRVNFGKEGVNYLMSVLMGGQMDVGIIEGCKLVGIDLSALGKLLPGPRYGVEGVRKLIGAYDRPLIGGIVKPKIGMDADQFSNVVYQMAKGGCDFIKEDEILANQKWCPAKERIRLVAKKLGDLPTLYAPCITGDGAEVLRKARQAQDWGASAIHLNVWCGLGAYRDVRRKVKLPLFFQKSGDRLWLTGPYAIDPLVWCQLINAIGCDFAHVGMYGGYLSEQLGELKQKVEALDTTIPSFSCGATPQSVPQLQNLFGNNIMISSGGYMCGHPEGPEKGAREFHEAIQAVAVH